MRTHHFVQRLLPERAFALARIARRRQMKRSRSGLRKRYSAGFQPSATGMCCIDRNQKSRNLYGSVHRGYLHVFDSRPAPLATANTGPDRRRFQGVAACAVIGIPHDTWGEAVHAVVVCKPDAAPSEDDIRSHCRQFIAGYKCPKTVEFRDQLPLSAAGKVLKRDIRAPYWMGKQRAVN